MSNIALLVSLLLLGISGRCFALEHFAFTHPCMGTLFSITLYADDEALAKAAADAAFARIDDLNQIASDYLPNSELSRLNLAPCDEAVAVSADMFALISKSVEVARLTDGAFDITAAHAIQQWRHAKRKGRPPTPEETKRAIALTDWRAIQLDDSKHTISKNKTGLLLDLGGIGKGYAADQAMLVLNKNGITRAVVAASGDLAIGDPPPNQEGWDITVRTFEKPEEHDQLLHLTLKNCGCSTSGDLHQFVEINGVRYSHIIDPKTGLGLTNRIACTVIAPNATLSDSFDTPLCVMGKDRGLALVKKLPDTQARFVILHDGAPMIFTSAHFPKAAAQEK